MKKLYIFALCCTSFLTIARPTAYTQETPEHASFESLEKVDRKFLADQQEAERAKPPVVGGAGSSTTVIVAMPTAKPLKRQSETKFRATVKMPEEPHQQVKPEKPPQRKEVRIAQPVRVVKVTTTTVITTVKRHRDHDDD